MRVIILFFIILLITGCAYPVLITCIAKIFWAEKSTGSIIKENNIIIGSALIAQDFTQDYYFWPRPSANNYKTIPSSASNLGPTSLELKNIINKRKEILASAHKSDQSQIPENLLMSSGSGLDPHILLSAVRFQAMRVIESRKLNNIQKKELEELIIKNTSKNNLTNVLTLNLALDQSFGKISL